MKKALLVFAGALATLSLIGPAFAQTAAPAAKDAPSTSTPAEKPSKLALPHHVTGEIVSVDQNAKTVTLKGAKDKKLTFTAEGGAVASLSALKAGDRVKVTYKNSHGHRIASKIAATEVASKTK